MWEEKVHRRNRLFHYLFCAGLESRGEEGSVDELPRGVVMRKLGCGDGEETGMQRAENSGEFVLNGIPCRCMPGSNAQFAVDGTEVGMDRARANNQLLSHFSILQSLRD